MGGKWFRGKGNKDREGGKREGERQKDREIERGKEEGERDKERMETMERARNIKCGVK